MHGVHLAVQTLAKMAVLGSGPPYFKDGRHPAYPIVGLDKFAIARLGRLRRSTSDDGKADRVAASELQVEPHRDGRARSVRGRTPASARRGDAEQQS
jgi:hypothetical protein